MADADRTRAIRIECGEISADLRQIRFDVAGETDQAKKDEMKNKMGPLQDKLAALIQEVEDNKLDFPQNELENFKDAIRLNKTA
ncbi:hypothetical protein KKB10_00405 [Patescibacteria group bacterium]|nr:hypothetical protein [Patescibacteria group bacterium]MBU1075176.1 hypothetical protein [Patescibacteria group bacterium]MBU1951970.1 hypothetical protein [Patescibacteria group bacterium]